MGIIDTVKGAASTTGGCLFMLVMLGLSLFYAVLGFVGIEYHLGKVVAWICLALFVIVRFGLPMTIGAFFGAKDVLHLEWYWALLIALPGLAVILPGMVISIVGSVLDRSRR